jgi:hypothetical protein
MTQKPKLEELGSPLKRIKNLREVDPKRASELEARLKTTYVRRMGEQAREARLRAEKLRDKILY